MVTEVMLPTVVVEQSERFPGEREWLLSKAARTFKHDRREERKANPLGELSPLAAIDATDRIRLLQSLIAELTAMGLSSDPHPLRVSQFGVVHKANGRAKKREAQRRREREALIEELRAHPVDEPLPISLTEIAYKVLQKGRRMERKYKGPIEEINCELQLLASLNNESGETSSCPN